MQVFIEDIKMTHWAKLVAMQSEFGFPEPTSNTGMEIYICKFGNEEQR